MSVSVNCQTNDHEQNGLEQDLELKLKNLDVELNEDYLNQKFDEKIDLVKTEIDKSAKSLREELSHYSARFKSGLSDVKNKFKM